METLPSMSREMPKRGEIWSLNLDPTIGAEIRKTRPVLVVSSDAAGRLPIKLIAPITEWDDRFSHSYWHVKIESTKANGLSKSSTVDTLQLRGVDLQRFIRKMGIAHSNILEEVAAAIAAVVEYQ